MADLYGAVKLKMLLGTLTPFTSGTVYATLVTSAYSVDFTSATPTYALLAGLTAGTPIALSSRVIAQALSKGTFDAADITFPAVSSVNSVIAVVLSDGILSGSNLLAYIDNLSNLPLTADGRDINLTWASPLLSF